MALFLRKQWGLWKREKPKEDPNVWEKTKEHLAALKQKQIEQSHLNIKNTQSSTE